jgi:Transglutaminase-like superfamily
VRNKNFKTDTFITKKVEQLTGADVTAKAKAEHIYKWVLKNIHYVAFENGMEGFVPRPADTVYKRKYGDCKDMSAIIVTMCRQAGVDAHFAWVGTSLLPYEHDDLPLNLLFNHMIAAVKLNGQWVFLDGTTRLLPFGSNRHDIQGKEAMIAIDDNKYEIVKIPFEDADKNVTVDSTHISIDGRKIAGSVKQSYKGYDAWKLCGQMLFTKKEEDREKAIRAITARGSNKYIQSKYDYEANEAGSKDVTIKSDFIVDDYVHQAGRQCFVNLNLLHYFEDNAVTKKDRTVPAYYDYKNKHKEVVVLDIPKGYRVKSLPAAVKGGIDGIWTYSISYKNDKNSIVLTKEYQLNKTTIEAANFAGHNKMVDDLKNIYKESVVLTAN